jgi:hypothetical protein
MHDDNEGHTQSRRGNRIHNEQDVYSSKSNIMMKMRHTSHFFHAVMNLLRLMRHLPEPPLFRRQKI